MKFATLAIVSTILTLTAQGLPMGKDIKVLVGDKRDLHNLCGNWFCGHTKREETTPESPVKSPTDNSEQELLTNIEKQTIRVQPLITSKKRDLHDLCGRWFCGHTRKRSVILRNYLRSSIEKSVYKFSS
ncbi:hypothetical protein K7432_013232 [Basidiobolus ranarum]|uniref:Uncharacterized protein n=1 Tax=Basidiobolus ranarum TaxID=34480 RepID=A0ABR2WJI1_9FUNG